MNQRYAKASTGEHETQDSLLEYSVLTGRKLMVDTYGGLGPHGGGAFSGKDPSKVDRSGAYMARLIAKTVVDAHLARECQVATSYAIGCSEPVAFHVDTFGTGTCPDAALAAAARTVFDLRPEAIIRSLDLRAPQYHRLATYGHLGREGCAWENTTGWPDQLRKEVQARFLDLHANHHV
ncbi:methionine adenosyltransferase [Cutibacterium namnetense]|uniref:methionine adenosyltransferase n=1 Tax=Cutibacterium namnetense TaxID=1574624 RepID=UPI003F64D6F5